MIRSVPFRRPARTRVGRWHRATAAALLAVLVAAGVASATAVTVGYRDFTYSGALASRATAEGTQSKLWFADGHWWGGLFRSSGMGSGGSRYEIFQLDEATQTWLPTSRVVDGRDRTHADYLWDGTHNKLYVTSSKSTCTSNPAPPSPPCNDAVRVYRYSYNSAASTLALRYTLDAGFPVSLVGGDYPTHPGGGADTTTIARDSTGRIWVVWSLGNVTRVASTVSDDDAATLADESTFSAPSVLFTGQAGQEAISQVLAYGGDHIGIYYTDKRSPGASNAFFVTHLDTDPAGTLSAPETVTTGVNVVQDQGNVKADSLGNVYVVVKTGLTGAASDSVRLFKRAAGGGWGAPIGITTVASGGVRPIVSTDEGFDGGNGLIIVTMGASDGTIRYKSAPLTGAGALSFKATGRGTALIMSDTDHDITDVTTTKQRLTATTGYLVAASDRVTLHYFHGGLDLPVADATAPTGGTVSINDGDAQTGSTGVTVSVPATDAGSGVAFVRLSNTAGCPTTTGLLTGGTTVGWGPTVGWTLTSGDGLKTVCVQWGDNAGNWSAPSSDTITLSALPGAPTGVTGTSANKSVHVSWTAPAFTGASAITGYTATSSPGGKTCTTTGALTCTVTGLTNGTAYTFTVKATNSDGTGPASAASAAVKPYPFTDIANSTFVDDIVWLYDSGITKGCTSTTYCPTANVSREQMAAFLVRGLKLPGTSTDYFTDDNQSTFQKEINALAKSGITKGCTPTKYCPKADVTRGQMAAFLVRALKLPPTSHDYFTDDNGSTFEANINALAASGITKGCTPTTYCPTESVTRGQMAAFLHRALD
jgi:hypothetical protein